MRYALNFQKNGYGDYWEKDEREVVQMDNAASTKKVKIKGYKKFMKRIRKMQKEVNQLNRSLEKAAELKVKLL